MLSFYCKLCRFGNRRSPRFIVLRTLGTETEVEVTKDETPPVTQYPPILDMSLQAVRYREKLDQHEVIRKLGTVEEKAMKFNMPRYYGWKLVLQREAEIPYNSLRYTQHITRTSLVSEPPPVSGELEEEAVELLNELRPLLEEVITFEMQRELPEETEEKVESATIDRARSQAVVQQLHLQLMTSLGRHLPHLRTAKTDPDPRVEAHWVVGMFMPPETLKKSLRNAKYTSRDPETPIDKNLQYLGKPLLQARSEQLLKPILDPSECQIDRFGELPKYHMDPRTLGFFHDRRFLTSIPGFWPGTKEQFGLVSYHARSHLANRPPHFGEDEHIETLHAQAILASYAWLVGQADFLGFNTYNELTYPLVTQTVITNGQLWSFYTYQLNTLLMHSKHTETNPLSNVCWTSQPAKLFEAIQDGKIIGLNEAVLKALLKVYLNAPCAREGVEMRPNLDPVAPYVALVENPDKRAFIEEQYKFMMSNRPRGKEAEEILHWEWIYKKLFNTRPISPRRKNFEKWINTYALPFDHHYPRYIPKVLRKEGREKEKFIRAFYP